MLHQYVADCLLEGGRHIGAVDLDFLHLAAVQIIQYGRFQAAEAEIIRRILEFRAWKRNGLRVSFLRNLIDLRAAGVAEAMARATLSKASPAASSRVRPRISYFP